MNFVDHMLLEQERENHRYQDKLRWSRIQTAALVEGGLLVAVYGLQMDDWRLIVVTIFGLVLIGIICALAWKDGRDCDAHKSRIVALERKLDAPPFPPATGLSGNGLMIALIILVSVFNLIVFYDVVSRVSGDSVAFSIGPVAREAPALPESMGPIQTGWIALLSGLAGAIVAHLLGIYREHRKRRKEIIGGLEALGIEIRICHSLGTGFLKGNVLAPAYRMPTLAYESVMPKLLSEGIFTKTDAEDLLNFYVNTRSFNLSLDEAQKSIRDEKWLKRESSRAAAKAENTEAGTHGNRTLFDKALQAVTRHLDSAALARMDMRVELSEPPPIDGEPKKE